MQAHAISVSLEARQGRVSKFKKQNYIILRLRQLKEISKVSVDWGNFSVFKKKTMNFLES